MKKQKIDGPHKCLGCDKRIPRRYAESHKKDCPHTNLTETVKRLQEKGFRGRGE
jgi:hypothetical protein